MIEPRTADLRFTPEEAAVLLNDVILERLPGAPGEVNSGPCQATAPRIAPPHTGDAEGVRATVSKRGTPSLHQYGPRRAA